MDLFAQEVEAGAEDRFVVFLGRVQARLRLKGQEAILAATQAKKPVLEAKVRQQEAELAAARRGAQLRIPERRALDEATAAVAKGEASLSQSRTMSKEAALRLA